MFTYLCFMFYAIIYLLKKVNVLLFSSIMNGDAGYHLSLALDAVSVSPRLRADVSDVCSHRTTVSGGRCWPFAARTSPSGRDGPRWRPTTSENWVKDGARVLVQPSNRRAYPMQVSCRYSC